MVSKEALAYLRLAKVQIRESELALKGSFFDLAAFLAASAGESASSALLTALGAKPSRKHRNSMVAARLARGRSSGAGGPREVAALLAKLEPHVVRSRYPIRKGPELLTPSEVYSREDAEIALEQSRRVLEIAGRHVEGPPV